MKKTTDFAKEQRLFESMFSEKTLDKSTKPLTEGLADSFKALVSKADDKFSELIIAGIATYLNAEMEDAPEDEETDLSAEKNTVIFKSKGNGHYIIRKEDEDTVKQLDLIAQAVWEHTDSWAGYEYLTFLMGHFEIPWQFDPDFLYGFDDVNE